MFPVRMSAAQIEELPLCMELLTEVSAWLAARGIVQWASPPVPELRALMAGEIDAGEVFLARLAPAKLVVGLLRFEWHDADLWPDDPDGGGYVHSLAVRPAFHGRQVGEAMLRWAAAYVRSRGRQALRLDCVAGNQALRHYYERLGFRYCGWASHAGYTGDLFELGLAPSAGQSDRTPGPSDQD